MTEPDSFAARAVVRPCDPKVLPIHLAIYWHGVAERIPGGARMRSAFGPYVECLAEVVERVTVVAHDPPADGFLAEDIADYAVRPERGNIDVLSLGPKGTWRDYWHRRRRVARLIRAASPGWDVLLLRFGQRAHLVFRSNRCARKATLVWGSSFRGIRQGRGSVRRSMLDWLFAVRSEFHLRRIVRSSGLVVTDGEECLARYGHLSSRMVLIRSSSRRSTFSFRAPDRLTGETPRFLFVGHLTELKGILEAIEAFALVREQALPRARLDVVGIGPELARAQNLVDERGIGDAVSFHGWLPVGKELFTLYRQADVLLLLSRIESFPRVVSEAMAHSVLVLATPVGSLPVSFEDGRDLLFVPRARPGAVVEAVKRLQRDPKLRHSMLARAFERAQETSLERVVDEILQQMEREWPEVARSRHGSVAGP